MAKAGMPRTAKSYVSRLRKSVKLLRDFPELGSIVEEFSDPSLREIPFDVYRIIYHYGGGKVLILTVHPAAQPLAARHLSGE
jgi:plasmid stabilization system protein ParE